MPRWSRGRAGFLPLAAAGWSWLCVACSSAPAKTPSGAANANMGSAGTSTIEPDAGVHAAPTGGAGSPAISAAGAPSQPSAAGTASAQPSAGVPAAAAGSGGGAAGASAPAAGSGGGAAVESAGAPATLQGFALTPAGAMMLGADEYAFPANALPPSNESPEFIWTGVPAGAKSLALVFRDLTAGAVKWVIWDIPPTRTGIPSHVSNQAMPAEVPGSSQLGSLGNQGYAGPCCMQNMYEFVLWALDVDKLPGSMGQTTLQLNNDLLPKHKLAATKPISLRRTTR